MHNFGGGRSDLFNSGGGGQKGRGIFSKFRGGSLKIQGGGGGGLDPEWSYESNIYFGSVIIRFLFLFRFRPLWLSK